MRPYTTQSPTTGEILAEFLEATDEQIFDAIGRSEAAFKEWRWVPLTERINASATAARLMRERAEELAEYLTTELGKPIVQALDEVERAASVFDYYAANAEQFLQDEHLEISGEGTAVVRSEPLGPLLGIMPWNFPYVQAVRFAAPNLILGNTIILKHARNCPQSALAIERIIREAGFLRDVYINVFASTTQVAEIIADPRVHGVSLTGSEKAGSIVAEIAGKHLKKVVLELGGSDPFIVLDDADVDKAVHYAMLGRFANAGQACTSSKRFIVMDGIYDAFLEKLRAKVELYSAGDPAQHETRLGPVSSEHAADELRSIIDDAVSQGASIAARGDIPSGARAASAFMPAMILTDVTPNMRAFGEELFGPIGVLYRVQSVEEAIELANDSPYGLGACLFTSSARVAAEVVPRLEVGMVAINSSNRSTPDTPFGGIKRSGFGRELSRFAFEEFSNKKLVRIVEPFEEDQI